MSMRSQSETLGRNQTGIRAKTTLFPVKRRQAQPVSSKRISIITPINNELKRVVVFAERVRKDTGINVSPYFLLRQE